MSPSHEELLPQLDAGALLFVVALAINRGEDEERCFYREKEKLTVAAAGPFSKSCLTAQLSPAQPSSAQPRQRPRSPSHICSAGKMIYFLELVAITLLW